MSDTFPALHYVKRRFACQLAFAALVQCLATLAVAQATPESIDWGASIRTRYESKQDFNFENSSQDYVLTQTRFHVSWRPDSESEFFIELQDARVAGESLAGVPPINEAHTPNVFADELDLHQVQWNREFAFGRLSVGRQKLNFGDQRLVASLEWVNTARVHDGVRLTLGDAAKRQVDVFASALVPVNPTELNDQASVGSRYLDSEFHGAFVSDRATLPNAVLEYWYYYRKNDDAQDEVSTVGIRFTQNMHSWSPDLQIAIQSGRFGGVDHSAWMLHAGVGRSFGAWEFRAAYNLASGDSDRSDARHGTFDNLFPLNHPYYGNMDLFALQNLENIELSVTRRLTERAEIFVSLNDFRLAEGQDAWYSAGLAPIRLAFDDINPHVGQELDVTLQMPFWSGRARFAAGVSVFHGGSYLRSFDLHEDALFFHTSLRIATN